MDANQKHPATIASHELLAECQMRRLRRSGPGGQHRNKVETAVVLRHLPSGVQAEANERRSQAENRAVAVFRLRVNLALEVRLAWGAARTPSKLWCSRCQMGQLCVSTSHDDFPALLAEALDVLAAQDMAPKPAATILNCTVSQLIKFLKQESRALALVNQKRRELGQHALR